MFFQIEIEFHQEKPVSIVAGKQHQKYPGDTTHHIIIHKFFPIHLNDAGYDRRKCADDGQESGKYNSLSSVLFIKGFCIQQMFSLKEKIVFTLKKIMAA